MQTHIDLEFANGWYRFALGLEQVNELQNACGMASALSTPAFSRPRDRRRERGHPAYAAYKIADLVETVRQGLIGGKMGEVDGPRSRFRRCVQTNSSRIT